MTDDNHIPTGTEKLQFMAEQLAELVPGQRPYLDCPYCFGSSRRGETFCCELLLRAVEAILDANQQIQTVAFMEKVIDRHLNN